MIDITFESDGEHIRASLTTGYLDKEIPISGSPRGIAWTIGRREGLQMRFFVGISVVRDSTAAMRHNPHLLSPSRLSAERTSFTKCLRNQRLTRAREMTKPEAYQMHNPLVRRMY